ncbi:phophatidylserine decarboxylase domain-containing protein [Trichoderma breve]|uniref:Phophatidylserine decarboxylase domain-containing protein n=1 Tax=Trichoderma breve TaxID=2034170 RepID=A0A9W9B9V6_9HYPO|nr:phophatidylserine decarboxylase domain-containing protein [Trichoderma breve]KAJ4857379.1 phophatidylserine decarboxylase domain-containing protein [Trichoderma breve]
MTPPGALPASQQKSNRVGGWLPQNPKLLISWLRDLVAEVNKHKRDASISSLFLSMFDEVPDRAPYYEDPIGNKQIKSYHEMLEMFDFVMNNKAPSWKKLEYDAGLIGFPFNAILDWPMATASGYAFFLKPEVNSKLKHILNTWKSEVLMTSKSQHVITTNEDGWLSQDSLMSIENDTNLNGQELTFQQIFQCDPQGDPKHWGFKSWDDFFVRKFKNIDQIRPVAFPEQPAWIANSCESKPFALQSNAQEYDSFWLKGQAYSVSEMLHGHKFAEQFVGGTVYQAFLSATSYHRWSSPVSGKVIHTEVVDGTYFSEPTTKGFTSSKGPDPASPNRVQSYISHIATRAIFFIEAPKPIGLMAAMYIGMADVSSCEILQKFDAKSLPASVEKGEEIGLFHHGGSTHCLLFRQGVNLAFVTGAIPGNREKNLPIRGPLAVAY